MRNRVLWEYAKYENNLLNVIKLKVLASNKYHSSLPYLTDILHSIEYNTAKYKYLLFEKSANIMGLFYKCFPLENIVYTWSL